MPLPGRTASLAPSFLATRPLRLHALPLICARRRSTTPGSNRAATTSAQFDAGVTTVRLFLRIPCTMARAHRSGVIANRSFDAASAAGGAPDRTFAWNSVFTYPGHTSSVRKPRPRYSIRNPSVQEHSAYFDAEYIVNHGSVTFPAIEATFTTIPASRAPGSRGCRSMCGAASRASSSGAKKFSSHNCRISSLSASIEVR